jgi:16S rRNA processing protein RimM
LERAVLLAVVTGALGLKGELKVKTFTDEPAGLARYGTLHTEDGRRLEIAALRPTKGGEAVVAFKGIADRTAAETLKGARLFVPRAALPKTAADEFYHTDLIGLAAYDGDGGLVGKVAAIHNFGAGDVIELVRASADGSGGDSVHLVFTRDTVPLIDIAGGRIVVAVPDEIDEDGGQER